MKTRPKRLLSSVLATMLLGQSLLCNNAIFTAFTAKAETTTNMTSNLDVSDINISGYINLEDGRTEEISVIVFDDSWNTVAETKVCSGEYFSVSATGVRNYSSTTHVKIECNGYLPRFYKDMGFGSYQLGTSESPETLYFGDTTYNPGANNQWSDEVINYDDLNFVAQQLGKIKGDENYDEAYDFNHDGAINNADIAIIAKYDGAIYENGRLYTSATKESYYIYPEEVLIYDLNQDNKIDSKDQQVICDLYPYESLKGDEDFDQFAYMDINNDGAITDDDYNYFQTYINLHNGCNPYNDYIYNLTLTGDSYHNSAMYLENTNLDLVNYKLVVNGNFVFRTQNPYHSMWDSNPGVTLNVNAGTLFIADQFDFGQANSYDKIVMTNDNGKLYVNGIWNYITLADMEGFWTKGTIYFFGSTWQVNEASGDKSIYSTGTHSICFYYQYGQQVIRWANTQDCIYNEETGEYNTHRRFNFDYKDNNGNCLGLTFPCGYSDDKYYFRASLPEEVTNQNIATTIPYEDWELLNDNNANTIPDIVDTQIENENYAAISNEWLEDNYGDTIDEFVVNEASFSIDDLNNNKKHFVDFLYYLKNTYDTDDEEYEKAMQILEYLKDSLIQIVAGDYAENTTIAGTIGQIVVSIVPSLIPHPVTWGLDLCFDLRDLSQNFVLARLCPESVETLEWNIDLFFDLITFIPEFGTAIKELKQVDKVTGVKGIKEFIYKNLSNLLADDGGKTLKNVSKSKEIIEKFIKDVKKITSINNEVNALSKLKGTDEVFEFYVDYGIEALENVSKHKKYYDKIKDVLKNFSNEADDILEIVDNYLKDEEEDSIPDTENDTTIETPTEQDTTIETEPTTEYEDTQLDYALEIIQKFKSDGIAALDRYNKITTLSAWNDIDTRRSTLNLRPFKQDKGTDPVTNYKPSTVAFADFNNERFWGINSTRYSEEEDKMARDYHSKYNKAYYPEHFLSEKYGGTSQVFMHAEGCVIMKVHKDCIENNINLPETLNIYIDRQTCGNCKNYQIELATVLGIKNLIMINSDAPQLLFCGDDRLSYYFKIHFDGQIEKVEYNGKYKRSN